jgi:hypothetical protein
MQQLPPYLRAELVTPALTDAMRSLDSFTDLTPHIAQTSQTVWWMRLGNQPPVSAAVVERRLGLLQTGAYYSRHSRDFHGLPAAKQLLQRRNKTDVGARLRSLILA